MKLKTRRWISWSFVNTFSWFISETVISLVGKSISGRGVRRAGRRYIDKKNLSFSTNLFISG